MVRHKHVAVEQIVILVLCSPQITLKFFIIRFAEEYLSALVTSGSHVVYATLVFNSQRSSHTLMSHFYRQLYLGECPMSRADPSFSSLSVSRFLKKPRNLIPGREGILRAFLRHG